MQWQQQTRIIMTGEKNYKQHGFYDPNKNAG